MALDWSQATDEALLLTPFSFYPISHGPIPTLLVKLVLTESPVNLTLLATDLNQTCWAESLSRRKLLRRIEKVGAGESQTQSEDELMDRLRLAVREVLYGVGSAVVEKDGNDLILTLNLPSQKLEFSLEPLGTASFSILAKHVAMPLIGLSAALLSTTSPSQVERAIDITAKNERLREGRAASNLFGAGGGRAMARFAQRVRNAKDEDIASIEPTTATSLISPSKRQRQPSPPPLASLSASSPSAPTPPKSSFAQHMLDHKGRLGTPVKGERVSWDETHVSPGGRDKGKRRADDDDEMAEKGEASEPGTDEDEEMSPPPAAQSSPARPRAVEPRYSPVESMSPPPPLPGPSSFSPTPSPALLVEPTPSAPPPKSSQREKEAEKAKAKRALHIERAKKATELKAASRGAPVKKKKKL